MQNNKKVVMGYVDSYALVTDLDLSGLELVLTGVVIVIYGEVFHMYQLVSFSLDSVLSSKWTQVCTHI